MRVVPFKLHHVWAFQGKSLPAVKSMSASLRVQSVNRKGSVEPSQEGRGTWPFGWSPFMFVRLCPHLPVGIVLAPYRRAGGNGSLFGAAQRFWTVDALSLVSRVRVVKPAGRRKNPLPLGMGSVNPV